MTDEQRKQVQDIALSLERITNVMGNSEMTDGLVDCLQFMHPTLIQSFTSKIIIRFIQRMAENYQNTWYDNRNKAACAACSAMWKALLGQFDLDEEFVKKYGFHLPLI